MYLSLTLFSFTLTFIAKPNILNNKNKTTFLKRLNKKPFTPIVTSKNKFGLYDKTNPLNQNKFGQISKNNPLNQKKFSQINKTNPLNQNKFSTFNKNNLFGQNKISLIDKNNNLLKQNKISLLDKKKIPPINKNKISLFNKINKNNNLKLSPLDKIINKKYIPKGNMNSFVPSKKTASYLKKTILPQSNNDKNKFINTLQNKFQNLGVKKSYTKGINNMYHIKRPMYSSMFGDQKSDCVDCLI
ncbi:WD repeat-containing protein 87 [Dictyocoela muelleri]|nr:WD repeat-containing protein 87 [Dictyocoela muelleri]